MDATCPLCRRTRRRLITNPPISAAAAQFARRLDPMWTGEDGCCEICVNTLEHSVSAGERRATSDGNKLALQLDTNVWAATSPIRPDGKR